MSRTKLFFLIVGLFIAVCLHAQIITTFAGTGNVGASGNGGPATAALLFDPQTICSDNQGNIYIPDHGNHVVRRVNSAGIISIFAGTGVPGNSGDGGLATAAQLGYPYGICIDNAGNVYISDPGYQLIRKVNPAGIISTIAGIPNDFGYSGDGGPATNARLYSPGGICADNAGNIYVAEFGSQVIRKISATGIISTVAGIGMMLGFAGDGGPAVEGQLNSPTGVSVDNAGNIYVADMGNSVIRKVNTAGIISTFAGGTAFGYSGDGGPATAAGLKFPFFIYPDNNGNVYISDTGNGVVRVVNSMGIITTIAGTGTFGYSGDGGPPISATFTAVGGICFDNAGNMYIADPGAHVIRKIGHCDLPSIILQPINQLVCEGANTAYTITATDVTNYQWQGNNGSGWTNLINNGTYTGATGNTLSITMVQSTMNGFQYQCIVTNNCGNIISSSAGLAISTIAPPTVHITTTATTICAGLNMVFTATPGNGGLFPSYQWKKNGINTGTNNAVYNDNTLQNGDIVTCVLTSNNNCSAIKTATSNAISITVNPLLVPTITIVESEKNICSGTLVSFSTSILNGLSNPSYQWKKNNIVTGTNSPVYIDNALKDGDIITCDLAFNENCLVSSTVTSNAIEMNVIPLVSPSVSINTTGTEICAGENVTYSAVSTSGGYIWNTNRLQ